MLLHRAFSCAALFAALAPCQSPPAGFTYQTLTQGLSSATAMAFLPDGRLLITERETGLVRVFRDGALHAAPWATLPSNGGGTYAEQGALGIAVDPDFLNNRYVYFYYTAASGQENVIARLRDVSGVGVNHTVLTPPGVLPCQLYHDGGAMTIGLDGTLYVATGDSLGGANAQDPQQWLGKVLRFSLPNLGVPANNPIPGNPVFSLGHRNQFGLTTHPVTGRIYQTENGGALMDELNVIDPGANYGWPYYEGTEAVPNSTYSDPLATFFPTVAPTGTCFYRGDHYPASYRYAWFFADYNMNRVRMVTLGPAGNAVTNVTVFHTLNGAGYGLASGPDGNLWFLTNPNGGFGASELGRWVHANEPMPSAQLSSVSYKTMGASVTVGVHAHDGEVVVPWLSLSRNVAPVSSPFGSWWVPLDVVLPAQSIVGDGRTYQGVVVPNVPSFVGSSIHLQAAVLTLGGTVVLTNPSEVVVRG